MKTFSPLCAHDNMYFQHHVISMELPTEANTSASHDSVVMIPNKFHSSQDVFTFKVLVQTHVWIKK